MSVRVRFAPSPTGPLHMGGVRTALFNYLFAKQNKGSFILRIEDTDQKRYVEGAEEYIKESLEWCGLIPDEGPGYTGDFGPYRQSERKEIYQKYVQILIDKGHAYYAFDTPEELDELRRKAESMGQTFIYNYKNRLQLQNSLNLGETETKNRLENKHAYVIRFKIPAGETYRFHDIIRGKMHIDTSTLDDKILMKNDGMPTYHLANIVDDHEMQISHVIRGEEWLPSLPLHLLMYDSFGWQAPMFAHLPLILKSEGKGKLSKRDGDKHGFPVFPLEWKTEEGTAKGYKEEGYFPEAFINMLALLGWNPGTEQEIFSLEELIQVFDINKVNNSGARFNPEKTIWFNHQYLQKKNHETLTAEFQKILKNHNIETQDDFDHQIVSILKERANFVQDIWEEGRFFYQSPQVYEEKGFKKAWKEDSAEILKHFLDFDLNYSSPESIQESMKTFVKENEIGFGKIMMPLRLALVGGLHGPDVPLIISILGKSETQNRVQALISFGEE